ncbi:MAG: hypothetical protein ACYCY9_03665 [Thiobacillus sp.]
MSVPAQHRRRWLRGILAAGCTLAVPALAGCGRRTPDVARASPGSLPSTGPAADVIVVELPADAPPADTAGKLTKVQAAYRRLPNGSERCDTCLFFIAGDNACKTVAGDISPRGWCTLWLSKQ